MSSLNKYFIYFDFDNIDVIFKEPLTNMVDSLLQVSEFNFRYLNMRNDISLCITPNHSNVYSVHINAKFNLTAEIFFIFSCKVA